MSFKINFCTLNLAFFDNFTVTFSVNLPLRIGIDSI